MSEEQYKIQDVTSDLRFLMTLTNFLDVDDEGYWFDPGEARRYLIQLDANDPGREVVLFQDPMPKGDHYFFNPYAEGFGKKSPSTTQFYKMLRIAFNIYLTSTLQYVAAKVLDHKESIVKDPEHTLSHIVVRMSSVVFDKKTTLFDVIDDKMIEEFAELVKRIDTDLINVPYLGQQITTIVTCDALEDPKWDEKYGKDIRKKSLHAFKALLMGVLGMKKVEDLKDFSVKYDAKLKTSAKLYTILSVYLNLYSEFNAIIPDACGYDGEPSPRSAIDLAELHNVLERSPMAYAIAKHMVQPVLPSVGATSGQTIDTSRLGANRFDTPQNRFAVQEIKPQGQGGFVIGGQGAESGSRFAPRVLTPAVSDPFAPASQQSFSSMAGVGVSSFAPNQPAGGGFGFGNSGFGGNGGFNLNPPNNFGMPTQQRRYFG